MIQNPVLRPNLSVEIVDGEGSCLIDENGIRIHIDPRYQLVLPLLDGKKSVDDIVDQLEGVIPTAEVYFTLMHLEDEGYTVESGSFNERTASDEFALLSAEPIRFRSNVKKVFVLVDNLTAFPNLESRFVSAFTKAGLLASTDLRKVEATSRTLRVVLTDDYLSPAVQRYHEARRNDGVDWLLVKPVGVTAWVGPLFSKSGEVCWDCLAHRLHTNRVAETYLGQRCKRTVSVPVELFSCVEEVAKSLVVGLIVNDYAQQRTSNASLIIEHDLRLSTIQRHMVVPRDTCSKCSSPATETKDEKVVLRSRPKVYTTDGGYRSAHPEQTLAREHQLVSRHTGLISHLFPLEGSSPLMPVYLARHNYGYRPSSLSSEAVNLANTSAGKGRTAAQARASAMCEAAERHSVFLQGYETIVPGSLIEMGDEAIHPNDCMLYSEKQYSSRIARNPMSSWVLRIPDPLGPGEVIDWSPVWSLTENRRKYLPTAYLYHTPHVATPPRGRQYCFSDSNGNASGNNLEEAILQGFLELVERDAVAIWWYNQVIRPVVDLDNLDDPYVTALLSAYGAQGRQVWVLDITHDFDIPVYVALSRKMDGPRDEILTGFGAHLDPRIAISRALTEINQMLPRVRKAPNSRRKLDEETETWFNEVTLETAGFLAGNAKVSISIPQSRGPETSDLIDDIRYCQELVENKGLEFLVLDQTRAETGLSSVKIIVPGMRHYWRRLAPGRLYEVPVKLGWLSSPTLETDLNPFSIL